MDSSSTPHNIVDRVGMLILAIGLSLIGGNFNGKLRIWRALGANQSHMLQLYSILCVALSWAFTFIGMASILLLDFAPIQMCQVVAYLCTVLYWGTKVFIYMYLVERALIVRIGLQLRDCASIQRSSEPTFIANVSLLGPYVGILVLMIMYNTSETTENEGCMIGLQQEASISLAIYDTLFSVIVTAQFVVPLMQYYKRNASSPVDNQDKPKRMSLREMLRNATTGSPFIISCKYRALAVRSLMGSIVALLVSLANVISLVQQPSQPMTYRILACAIDVAIGFIFIDYMSKESARKTRLRRISRFRFGNSSGRWQAAQKKSVVPTRQRHYSVPSIPVAVSAAV